MPGFLRKATASQARALGPFVSDSDFKTVQTGLTIANTDIKLVVNGAASANKNSGGGTHRANGVYGVTFDATDTGTVGEMEVNVLVSGALVVFDKFFVIEAAVYDALYAASAAGYGTAQTGDSFARLGAPAGASVSADTAAVKVDTAAVKVQTDKLVFSVANQVDVNVIDWKGSAAPAMTGDAFARLGAPAGASVSVDMASVKTDTAAIKTKTDFLPSATAGAATGVAIVGSAMTLAANAVDAAAMKADADAEIAEAVWQRAFSAALSNYTAEQLMNILMALIAGICTGLDTGSMVFKNLANTATVVSMTGDANGNRSSPSYSP